MKTREELEAEVEARSREAIRMARRAEAELSCIEISKYLANRMRRLAGVPNATFEVGVRLDQECTEFTVRPLLTVDMAVGGPLFLSTELTLTDDQVNQHATSVETWQKFLNNVGDNLLRQMNAILTHAGLAIEPRADLSGSSYDTSTRRLTSRDGLGSWLLPPAKVERVVTDADMDHAREVFNRALESGGESALSE